MYKQGNGGAEPPKPKRAHSRRCLIVRERVQTGYRKLTCLLKVDCVHRVKYFEANQGIQRSDHTPLCLGLATQGGSHMFPVLLESARRLFESYHKSCEQVIRRTPRCDTVNLNDFINASENLDPPSDDVPGQENAMNAISSGCEVLSMMARQGRKRGNQQEKTFDVSQPRWERILDTNNLKLIWEAIDWSRKVDIRQNVKPDDEQFKSNFENLVNSECQGDRGQDFDESVPTISVLDYSFTIQEIEKVIQNVNVNKSYEGISPGLIKVILANCFY